MHIIHKNFAMFNTNKRFFQTTFAHAQRFYLRAHQGNACLIGIVDEIIVKCLLIVGDQLDAFFLCHP